MNEIMDAALKYAGMGFPVLPVRRDNKAPYTPHGLKDASTNPDVIRDWWKKWENANVAIRTDGLCVLDIDMDDLSGKDGNFYLLQWQREHHESFPETWTARTGRGGYHLYYKADKPVSSHIGIIQDVDIRGEGGYTIAPPSVHANGNRYEWVDGSEEEPMACANAAVYHFLEEGRDKPAEGFALPEKISQGKRNGTIFKLAACLQGKGLPDAAVLAACAETNKSQCEPPLADKEVKRIVSSAMKYEKGKPEHSSGEILNIECIEDVEERETQWLIPSYIPRGVITLLASDGGLGKSSTGLNLAAAVSSGHKSLFHEALDIPFDTTSEPGRVFLFSGEDSAEYVMRRKLRMAGANLGNILYADVKSADFARIKFDSPILARTIRQYQPKLVIFDPLQSFTGRQINLSARNEVRAMLQPLAAVAEETSAAVVIVMHTNKMRTVAGRSRIADSSDLWDLARAVFICGRASAEDDNLYYLSVEKQNGAPRGKTILYSIDDGLVRFEGTDTRHDEDFVFARSETPTLTAAKETITELLSGNEGTMPIRELDELAKGMGMSSSTLKKAKSQLKADGKLKIKNSGYGNTKIFTARLTE